MEIKLSWDSSLPDEIVKPFFKWWNEIKILSDVEIPHYFEINESTQMHVFVDACKEAYATCIFFRSNTSQGKFPVTRSVSLPSDRVKDAAVFEEVGVDLAGLLYVKRGDKFSIVLYTYAIYRALHIELVSSLSADAFLLYFRRFVARRGRPRTIYSDNSTNFRGAYNELADIDWNEVFRYAEIQRIAWKFIPPTAAWWGGFWERLGRTMKELLRRTLGEAIFTYEELITFYANVKSVIFTFIDISVLRYAGCNSNYARKSSNIQVDDIVLIGDDWKKRLQWHLASVIKLIPGKDGLVSGNDTTNPPLQKVQQTDSSVNYPNPDALKANEKPQVSSVSVLYYLKSKFSLVSALFSHTRAFGDRPRNLEPWSSDEDDTRAATPPLLTTTPAGGRLSSRQIQTHDIPATSLVTLTTKLPWAPRLAEVNVHKNYC
ncbi:integrase catalytic domain-containing protein [Trichonephila clavipes]|uniref:Integrase catalytic domain-containing protein n=1 Tax=Trichonephila clavipes TaxID=2585209 RepID=A0A8X6T1H7_TRICX|nr:integrase catalytic domain-containing protein [Trichonephila clavipes]